MAHGRLKFEYHAFFSRLMYVEMEGSSDLQITLSKTVSN